MALDNFKPTESKECNLKQKQELLKLKSEIESLKSTANDILKTKPVKLLNAIKNLDNCNDIGIWKFYFEKAFDKISIQGKDLEEKFNNFLDKSLEGKTYLEDIPKLGIKKGDKILYQDNLDFFKLFKGIVLDLLGNYIDKEDYKGIKINLSQIDDNININNMDNKYLIFSYYTYMERNQSELLNDNEYLQKQKDLSEGKINIEEFNNYIKTKLGPSYENFSKKMNEKAKVIEIFEKESSLKTEEITTELQNAIKKGLRFRKLENALYCYTTEGIFIGITNYPPDKNYISNIINKYQNVDIKDYIKIEIDQETKKTSNYIEDQTFLTNLQIPKYYAEIFKKYQEKGYKFKIDSVNMSNFHLCIIKNGSIISDINNGISENGKVNLWLDILVNRSLPNLDENIKAKYNNPELDPKTIIDKKINFVNEVYDLFLDEKGKVKENLTVEELIKNIELENLIKIGIKNKLPLSVILQQVTFIFEKLNDKGLNVYRTILENPNLTPSNQQSFLQKFNISEKDYINTKNSYINSIYAIIENTIKAQPKLALQNFNSLLDLFSGEGIKLRYDNNPNLVNGMNKTIVYLLNLILSNDVSLKDSEETKKLFKKYPFLEEQLKQSINTFSQTQSLATGTSSFDVMNSVDYGNIKEIQSLFKDEWFEGYNFEELVGKDDSKKLLENDNIKKLPPEEQQKIIDDYKKQKFEKTKIELKLAIARNLLLQYTHLNFNNLKEDLLLKGEELVKNNFDMIIKQRKLISNQEIFSKNIFHIAHYGQGTDAFGTIPTQEAFQYQAGNKKYTLFDAKTIFDKSKIDGEVDLDQYINNFIFNPKAGAFVKEGHANAVGFSVLLKHKKEDKLGINFIGLEQISISPKQLVDIIIKREKGRKQNNIKEPDIIIFSACKGDYAINFFNELNNRKNEIGSYFIPPAVITAAESGENSKFFEDNLDKEIPYQIFRYALDIGNKQKTTYGTFFQNQHSLGMNSNPSLFYPVLIKDPLDPTKEKWVPQQLG